MGFVKRGGLAWRLRKAKEDGRGKMRGAAGSGSERLGMITVSREGQIGTGSGGREGGGVKDDSGWGSFER